MKRILITGAAGFIGLNLAKKLNGEHKVDLIDNFYRGKKDEEFKKIIKKKNVNFINCDLSKKINIKKQYDYIFHLASIVGVQNVISKPYEVLKSNIILLENLIDFSYKQKRLKRIFFFSTSEVYADSIKSKTIKFPTPENQMLTISDLSNNRSTYSLSKIYGEALCLHSGLPFIIVRPHNIYGPRMGFAHVIPQLTKKIFKNKRIVVFNPKHRRTFFYIDDLVNILILLMNKKKLKHKIYNIGNQKDEISILNLLKKIMSKTSIRKKIIQKKINNSSPKRRIPKISRLKDEFKIKNLTSLDKGLDHTLNWYKEYFKS